MAESSDHLGLPYLASGQAQKHITHNEALKSLDALVQLCVTSRTIGTPPANPAAGERYIVPSGASGAFAGKIHQIAAFQNGAWAFYPPEEGWIAHVNADNTYFRYAGGQWQSVFSGVPMLGINMAASSSNRLTLASEAALFSHGGADHRLTINKAAGADTGSVIFAVGHSGRVEMGLCGDNRFVIKVSADGSNWSEALRVDPNTGEVSFPNGVAN